MTDPHLSRRRIGAILGCLAALGPLSIDAYLPAMPAIAADFGTDQGAVQLSLMAFFLGLTLGQLVYGPLSDRHGRKPPTYAGLALFVAASVACGVAPTPSVLLAARFCQGLGGSIGMVISIAVVRDLYSGHAAASLMALIVMVLGVAPVVAPLIGSLAVMLAGWPLIFFFLAASGAVVLAAVSLGLPETRQPEQRRPGGAATVAARYGSLLVNRRFLPFVASLAVAQGGFFAFISASPEVFVGHFGLSPVSYSLLFALDAAALMLVSRFNVNLLRRFCFRKVVRAALAVYATTALLLAGAVLAGAAPLVPVAVATLVVVASMGAILPTLNIMAMESFGAMAGSAAALIGACQFGGGALASGLVGSLSDGTPAPMAVTIAVCGVASLLIALFAFPAPAPQQA